MVVALQTWTAGTVNRTSYACGVIPSTGLTGSFYYGHKDALFCTTVDSTGVVLPKSDSYYCGCFPRNTAKIKYWLWASDIADTWTCNTGYTLATDLCLATTGKNNNLRQLIGWVQQKYDYNLNKYVYTCESANNGVAGHYSNFKKLCTPEKFKFGAVYSY